jgi:hypothetical protein
MRIADNIACHCAYYRGLAEQDLARGVDVRSSRVKTAKKFSRLAFACLAGDQPMRHPAFKAPDSILEKLREFHRIHETPLDQVLTDLSKAIEQLPGHTKGHEAKVMSEVFPKKLSSKRRAVPLSELLVAVLARLGVNEDELTNNDTIEPGD